MPTTTDSADTIVAEILDDAPSLMTRGEVAALMRCRPATVTRWVREGRLRAVKTDAARNSPLLVPRRAVAELLAEMAQRTHGGAS